MHSAPSQYGPGPRTSSPTGRQQRISDHSPDRAYSMPDKGKKGAGKLQVVMPGKGAYGQDQSPLQESRGAQNQYQNNQNQYDDGSYEGPRDDALVPVGNQSTGERKKVSLLGRIRQSIFMRSENLDSKSQNMIQEGCEGQVYIKNFKFLHLIDLIEGEAEVHHVECVPPTTGSGAASASKSAKANKNDSTNAKSQGKPCALLKLYTSTIPRGMNVTSMVANLYACQALAVYLPLKVMDFFVGENPHSYHANNVAGNAGAAKAGKQPSGDEYHAVVMESCYPEYMPLAEFKAQFQTLHNIELRFKILARLSRRLLQFVCTAHDNNFAGWFNLDKFFVGEEYERIKFFHLAFNLREYPEELLEYEDANAAYEVQIVDPEAPPQTMTTHGHANLSPLRADYANVMNMTKSERIAHDLGQLGWILDSIIGYCDPADFPGLENMQLDDDYNNNYYGDAQEHVFD